MWATKKKKEGRSIGRFYLGTGVRGAPLQLNYAVLAKLREHYKLRYNYVLDCTVRSCDTQTSDQKSLHTKKHFFFPI